VRKTLWDNMGLSIVGSHQRSFWVPAPSSGLMAIILKIYTAKSCYISVFATAGIKPGTLSYEVVDLPTVDSAV